MTGRTLAHYQVLDKLGQGGMGEVYRARDTKLGRDVAIKVLPEALSKDRERLLRFEREAQVLAALNHPNIAAIYGIENSEGVPFLVLEMVPGESPAGPMPPDEAHAICLQIADAIEAAHEKGIVHRDLKPANIKVTPDGQVKVLDFGLAKALAGDPISGASASSPTLTVAATQAGVLMGTAAYMSPEQARGRPAGRRADVWAFGCVYYELLTGRKAFDGDNISDVLAAVLKTEPDWSALPASTSLSVRRLLRLCLEKDPKKRLRDIGDAWLEAETSVAAPTKARPFGWIAAGLLAVALAGLALVHFREQPPVAPSIQFHVAAPDRATGIDFPAISPDGRRLAFVATQDNKRMLWIRPLDSVAAQPLAGTEDAGFPFWSPDNRFVAFFAGDKLKKIDAAGGPPQTLCSTGSTPRGGAWGPYGQILFVPGNRSPVMRVSAAGGFPAPVTTIDTKTELSHRWPQFLPDGKHFLYWVYSQKVEEHAVIVGSLDDPPASTARRRLFASGSMAAWSAGHLLFEREGTLMAQTFDLAGLRLTGEPFPVAQRIGGIPGAQGFLAFSATPAGTLGYRPGGGVKTQFVWYDRAGKELGHLGPPDSQGGPELSPDGKRVAITRYTAASPDVYLLELAREASTRFTFHPQADILPIWSPDGGRVAFMSNRGGAYDVYLKPSTGVGDEELLLKSTRAKYLSDWSPDGRYLVYSIIDEKTAADIWAVPVEGDRKPFPVVLTESAQFHGKLSPDGRWIAYQSDESSPVQIFVQAFPKATGKFQVSTGNGYRPRWRPDGKELYYLTLEQHLMAVEVKATATAFEAGRPRELFRTRATGGSLFSHTYDVSADDQRFLINSEPETGGPTPLTVVVNWAAKK